MSSLHLSLNRFEPDTKTIIDDTIAWNAPRLVKFSKRRQRTQNNTEAAQKQGLLLCALRFLCRSLLLDVLLGWSTPLRPNTGAFPRTLRRRLLVFFRCFGLRFPRLASSFFATVGLWLISFLLLGILLLLFSLICLQLFLFLSVGLLLRCSLLGFVFGSCLIFIASTLFLVLLGKLVGLRCDTYWSARIIWGPSKSLIGGRMMDSRARNANRYRFKALRSHRRRNNEDEECGASTTFHADHWPFPEPSLFVSFFTSITQRASVGKHATSTTASAQWWHTLFDLLAQLRVCRLSL